MSDQRDIPTCELGFWAPLHSGCPVCGPDGPCRDPEYEAQIQAYMEARRFRKALFIVSAVILLVMFAGWVA